VQLNRRWTVGARIGGGGFGAVFEAHSDSERAAIKLVPKMPGADRELLFVDLDGVRNVVPVIDSGETADGAHYALIMPRADRSLADYLNEASPLDVPTALAVLTDIAEALADLEAQGVVHRDLKPANVLSYNGKWCLADFGISRYAEATTAPDTQKFALSPPYAAPERWRDERATPATDVYSLGVMAFEMLSGRRPFPGPAVHDYREQQLHDAPPPLKVGAALAALVVECLYKSPEPRPRAGNLLARLSALSAEPPSGGLAQLQHANRVEVERQAAAATAESAARSNRERRDSIAEAAEHSLKLISDSLRQTIVDNAPAATSAGAAGRGWVLTLGSATLQMTDMQRVDPQALAAYDRPAPIDVIGYASISVVMRPANTHGYDGRGHSLWFCDAETEESYQWFELAFMDLGLLGGPTSPATPYAMPAGMQAGEALSPVLGTRQLAWGFTRLVAGQLDDFIDRWANWCALAAQRRLAHPSHMPERTTTPPRRQNM
jgi:serine/threonine protein kinase